VRKKKGKKRHPEKIKREGAANLPLHCDQEKEGLNRIGDTEKRKKKGRKGSTLLTTIISVREGKKGSDGHFRRKKGDLRY